MKSVCGQIVFFLGVWLLIGFARSQESPTGVPPTAFKWPDGTIVLYSQSGKVDATIPVDAVRLSAKEYATLLEKANRANQAIPPGECSIEMTMVDRSGQLIPTLTFRNRIKTTKRNQAVQLGLKGAVPIAVRYSGGSGVPLLKASEDGIHAIVEEPGECELIVVVEVNPLLRNGGIDRGIDVGLPGSVLTSFSLIPPNNSFTHAVLTTQSPLAGAETIRLSGEKLTARQSIGSASSLAVSWPSRLLENAIGDRMQSVIDVRIGESDCEIVNHYSVSTRLRQLRMTLPADSELAFDGAIDPRPKPAIQRQPDARTWQIDLPEPGNWPFIVTTRVKRSNRLEVGPYRVEKVGSHTGQVRLLMPAAVRLIPDLREGLFSVEPPAIDPKPEMAFDFRSVSENGLALSGDLRTVKGIIQTRANHRLQLIETGWQWRSTVKFTPRYRDVRELTVSIPAGWSPVQIGPDELVDEVVTTQKPDGRRLLTIRLAQDMTDSFDLTFDAIRTIPIQQQNTINLALPELVDVNERDSRIVVKSTEQWTLNGSISGSGRPIELTDDSSGKNDTRHTISGTSTRAISTIHLEWRPYRPTLISRSVAEIVLQDRQTVINQTITLSAPTRYPRPIRLRGPASAVGLRIVPTAIPITINDYQLAWPGDQKELTITLSYALPTANQSNGIELVWPEDATDSIATIHAWGLPGTQLVQPRSTWKIGPPAAVGTRDSYPWLTLSANRIPGQPAPTWLPEFQSLHDVNSPDVIIESAAIALGADDSKRMKARYWLIHLPASGFDVSIAQEANGEFWLDGRKWESIPPAATQSRSGFTTLRLNAPEPKANRGGVLFEIRQTQSSILPIIERSMLSNPMTWVIEQPSDRIVLPISHDFSPNVRWSWKRLSEGFGFVSLPIDSRLQGPEAEWPSLSESLSGRSTQSHTAPTILSWPRSVVIAIGSGMAVALTFGFWKWRRQFGGVLLLFVGGLFLLGIVVAPLIVCQLVIAMQLGIVLSILGSVVGFVVQRTRDRLPGFTTEISSPALRPSSLRVTPLPRTAE